MCLDTAATTAAAAVAVGSLNFKSQRAGRGTIDGRTRAVVGSLDPYLGFLRPLLSVLLIVADDSRALSNFLPSTFSTPSFLVDVGLFLLFREAPRFQPVASTVIMQNNYRGMRSAVPRRTR